MALGDPRDDRDDRSAGGLGLLTTLHPPIALAALGDIGALVSGPRSTGGEGRRPAGWCFPARSDARNGRLAMAPTTSTTGAEDAAGSRRSRPVGWGSRAVPVSPSSGFVTLAGLAPQTESRSNEPSVPLPETDDGENAGDALGESKVKSSSTSSAALGLSIEWDVSLATLSGPRGESPGSSLETSRAGGGAMSV